MNAPLSPESSLRRQAINTFLRARKLPPSSHRSDLMQLAYSLLRLHRIGLRGNVEVIEQPTRHCPVRELEISPTHGSVGGCGKNG